MKCFSLIFTICLLSVFCWSKPLQETRSQSKDVKSTMDEFLSHLVALKKFMISEEKFADPKNELEISMHLNQFVEAASQAQHAPLLNQENFRFSRQVLKTQLSETARVFRLGNKTYARWMLNSTISICLTCHSQMPTPSRTFKEFENHKTFTSEFDQAEFLFATRAFDKAAEMYDRLITGFPTSTDRIDQLEKSLERQIAFYSRIKRGPKEALTKISQYQKNKKLPAFLLKNMEAWSRQLKTWSLQKDVNPRSASESEIVTFAEANLDSEPELVSATNPKLVNYLRVSGILYEYLMLHPHSKTTPKILYWLAVCDRALNHTFFYSLANLYLRECITEYPTDPMANTCLKEYQEEIISGYTGSAGTHLPAEVQADLKQLKDLIEGKKK